MTADQGTLELEEPRQASAELLEHLRPKEEAVSIALMPLNFLRCSACGKRLKPDHCVIGKNKTLTDGRRLPRYCWPGEGCNK